MLVMCGSVMSLPSYDVLSLITVIHRGVVVAKRSLASQPAESCLIPPKPTWFRHRPLVLIDRGPDWSCRQLLTLNKGKQLYTDACVWVCVCACVMAKPLCLVTGKARAQTWSQILQMKWREPLSILLSFVTHAALLLQFNLNDHRVIFLFVIAVSLCFVLFFLF